MIRRPEPTKTGLAEINMLNLVDVMLVLLIIFILVAPIMEHGIDVRLPSSSPSSIQPTGETLTVSIAPPGRIYLDDRRVTIDELKETLARAAAVNPQTPVTLRGDEKLDYGLVVTVLDGIKSSGISRIGIATVPAGGKR
ncbi:MAG TPA: biopolymer transporter ExbD [bacterium]|nr:biopolymer transporter ExbD [bacterium]HPQ65645.1 biopolymer transporter ExbD [bacterium]